MRRMVCSKPLEVEYGTNSVIRIFSYCYSEPDVGINVPYADEWDIIIDDERFDPGDLSEGQQEAIGMAATKYLKELGVK